MNELGALGLGQQFGAQAHAGDGGAQVVRNGSQQAGAFDDVAADAFLGLVEAGDEAAQFDGAFVGDDDRLVAGADGVLADVLDGAVELAQ